MKHEIYRKREIHELGVLLRHLFFGREAKKGCKKELAHLSHVLGNYGAVLARTTKEYHTEMLLPNFLFLIVTVGDEK